MLSSKDVTTPRPKAPRHSHTHVRVTGDCLDPYAWLRDIEHPDTMPYLNAENEYSQDWFSKKAETVSVVFDEIKSRIVQDDLSAPMRHGPWWYTSQTLSGSGYSVLRRGESFESAADIVVFDENKEASLREFFSVGDLVLSPDHNLLAYSCDTNGGESFVAKVRDLRTNKDLADTLVNVSDVNMVWSLDARYLFYVTHNEVMRPDKVWRHEVGTPSTQDVLVVSEHDDRFYVSLSDTRSGNYICVESNSHSTSECSLISTRNPTSAPVLVRARETGVEYCVHDWGDCLLILTNLHAPDFRVMSASVNAPSAWSELLGATSGRFITALDVFKDFLIVHLMEHAQQSLIVLHRDGTHTPLSTGSLPSSLCMHDCPDWETTVIRYECESLVSPVIVYDHNVVSDERVVIKSQDAPNVDVTNYVSTREWVDSADGVKIPVDIVYHKDTLLDGSAPGLIYGYGAYGESVTPWFSVSRLSLLDRGWVWALAHPRGGGECASDWHAGGKLLNKKNTFTDMHTLARYLQVKHVGKLAIRGGSAGGLMVAACVVSEPTLYGAAIAEVPFVDVVTSMSDPSIPLTALEWDEWGDPRSEPYASYMLSYSPYDHTTSVNYPSILVTTGIADPRVGYHESAKWVAKMRHMAIDDALLLFRCDMESGHQGKSDRYDQWLEESEVITFLLSTLG